MMMDLAKNDLLWIEYDEYIHDNKLTKYERQLLRKRIRDGHSVYEIVESRYLPGPAYPPMDFIDAYRFDRGISDDIKGMSEDEREAYLKDLFGYTEPSPEEIAMDEAKRNTPKLIENRVRQLERELFSLWDFIQDHGYYNDAKKYVEEHRDEEIPFEW